MKTNKWDLAWLVLGAALCIFACMMFLVFVVEIAVRSPFALLGALVLGAASFVLLSDFRTTLEVYKERKKSEKKDEKV